MKFEHTPTERIARRDDPYARARRSRDPRDASAGWREEHHYQAAPLPDGGEPDADDEIPASLPQPGRVARDRDDLEATVLVVETLPDTRADEYRIEATGNTVYEHNRDYPPWSPVVRAVYVDALDALTEWRGLGDLEDFIQEGGVRAYTFPAARLAPKAREIHDGRSPTGGDGE
jgi:hypothetical protein